MPSSPTFTGTDVLACSTIFVFLILVWLSHKTASAKQRLPLPPGPKGYPIIGNALHRPLKFEWKTYHEWSKKYDSDVVATKLFNTNVIILNSLDAVNELFDKRSSYYSGRPELESFTLMGMNEWNVPVFPYGGFWRQCRKVMHQGFHAGTTKLYYPHQLKATHEFMRRILKSPDHLAHHVKHMAGETILSITYGIDVQPENDPYIGAAELQVAAGTPAITPGYSVDFIPLVKHIPSWLPGGRFKRYMQWVKNEGTEMMERPMRELKAQMAKNIHRPSFVSRSLKELEGSDGLNDSMLYDRHRALRGAAGSLYLAGSDTTTSTILSVFLGLLSNPAAFREAQAQIDTVVGRDRLPNFSDRQSLPWVTAVVYEALRWNPVTPIGVPHAAGVDDEFRGFHIPAGSIMIANTWGILHDETVYPDPLSFKPERFLNSDGLALRPDVKDPTSVAFGYGRRICPGRHMAQSSVWITTASIIAAFDVSKAKDRDGQYIEPSYEYTSAVVSAPQPFACSITPRDAQAREIVEGTVQLEYELN